MVFRHGLTLGADLWPKAAIPGRALGADAIVFSLHRIYGPIRLPMLTASFLVVGVITRDNIRHLNQFWGMIQVHTPRSPWL